jgi:hypothetical protein
MMISGRDTLRALVEVVAESVLPTGIVPVTAAVTVIRYGESLAARVRFDERDWEDCDPHRLATYVSEAPQDLSMRLREIAASGERALTRARELQAAGASAVSAELERIRRLRSRVEALSPPREV